MDAGLFFEGSGTTLRWEDVAVVIECKYEARDSQSKAQTQLKQAAERVFGNQFRLFVWGLSIYSRELEAVKTSYFRLYLYTRSGIIQSCEYPLHESFASFCKLLVGFARMKPEQHGWYLVERPRGPFSFPHKVPASQNQQLQLTGSIHDEPLYLEKVLDIRGGIKGRATLVLLCSTLNRKVFRVVKLTWLSQHHVERYKSIIHTVSNIPSLNVPTSDCKIVPYPGTKIDLSTLTIVHGNTHPSLPVNITGFSPRNLFCVIGDKPGVTIQTETSLKRLLLTFAEVIERTFLTRARAFVSLLILQIRNWEDGSCICLSS